MVLRPAVILGSERGTLLVLSGQAAVSCASPLIVCHRLLPSCSSLDFEVLQILKFNIEFYRRKSFVVEVKYRAVKLRFKIADVARVRLSSSPSLPLSLASLVSTTATLFLRSCWRELHQRVCLCLVSPYRPSTSPPQLHLPLTTLIPQFDLARS